jgi:hypothetical protein
MCALSSQKRFFLLNAISVNPQYYCSKTVLFYSPAHEHDPGWWTPYFVLVRGACQTASVAVGKECIFYTVIKLHRSTAWGRSASRLGNGSIWASPGSAPTWQRKQKRAALLFIQIYYKRGPENRLRAKMRSSSWQSETFMGNERGETHWEVHRDVTFLLAVYYIKWRENMVLKSCIFQAVMAGDLKSWRIMD